MARTSIDTAVSSSKSAPSKPKKSGGGGGSNLDKNQKIKLGIAIGAIVIAALLLAYQFELISFGGGNNIPSEPDVSAEQQAELDAKVAAEQNAPPPPMNAPTRRGSQ